MDNKKRLLAIALPIAFIAIGCISIVTSIVCFAADTGVFERESAYGGDAYTGIQNASAITANNVKCLAGIASIGFGSVLLVAGLTLIAFGVIRLLNNSNGIVNTQSDPKPIVKTATNPNLSQSDCSVDINKEQVVQPAVNVNQTSSTASNENVHTNL